MQKKITLSALGLHWKRGQRSAMLPGILGTGIRVGANIVLIPLILRLSAAEQALWWVFVALGNFGNLADFGFGSTIPRIYSYLYAGAEDFDAEGLRPAKTGGEPNFAGISRLNATVRSLYLKFSLAAIGLLAIGGTIYLLKPAAESGSPHKIFWLWALFLMAIGYNLATIHWVLAVQGLNRVRDLQIVYVWGGLSFVSCVALLMYCKLGLASMVIATFVKGFIMHGRCRQIYKQVVPEPEQPAAPDPQVVRKLWPNSYKFAILALGSYCLASGPVLICGQLLGQNMTASFGLTAQIGNFLMSFAALWLLVKWPEIAILRAQGRLHEMAALFARRLTLVMLTFIGLALMFLFCGDTLLMWMGKHTRLLPMPCLAFYLFYLMQQVFYVQFGSLAYTENVVPFFKIGIYTGLAAFTLSLIMTPLFGLWGLLIAPWIVETACSAWFTVRRGFQGQPLAPRQFMIAALRGHT